MSASTKYAPPALDPNFCDAEGRVVDPSHHLALVSFIAREYERHIGRDVDWDDLMQAGYLGLDRACRKFEHARGLKFSTYAQWHIRAAMQRCIAYARWECTSWTRPFKKSRFHVMVRSFDSKFEDGEQQDPADPRPFLDPHDERTFAELWDLLTCDLRPRWREVARLRFIEGKKLHEIGAVFGITLERVRQILAERVMPRMQRRAVLAGLVEHEEAA